MTIHRLRLIDNKLLISVVTCQSFLIVHHLSKMEIDEVCCSLIELQSWTFKHLTSALIKSNSFLSGIVNLTPQINLTFLIYFEAYNNIVKLLATQSQAFPLLESLTYIWTLASSDLLKCHMVNEFLSLNHVIHLDPLQLLFTSNQLQHAVQDVVSRELIKSRINSNCL